jgi:hypothetical protein
MSCNDDFCKIDEYPEKRDLDGCYFRVERNGKYENLCFSDMTETERGKVMAGKGVPWFISLSNCLADSLHAFGDAFDVYGRE